MNNLVQQLSEPWRVDITTKHLTHELKLAFYRRYYASLELKTICGLLAEYQSIFQSHQRRCVTLDNRPLCRETNRTCIRIFRPKETTPHSQ